MEATKACTKNLKLDLWLSEAAEIAKIRDIQKKFIFFHPINDFEKVDIGKFDVPKSLFPFITSSNPLPTVGACLKANKKLIVI